MQSDKFGLKAVVNVWIFWSHSLLVVVVVVHYKTKSGDGISISRLDESRAMQYSDIHVPCVAVLPYTHWRSS